MRYLLTLAAVLSVSMALAEEPARGLPKPHYDFEPNDPAWLKQAVQFHGHLGPWAAAGLRLGLAGAEAVAAEGYFDVDVVAVGPFVKPPHSCFLDGVQVATGATWGKRNIEWVKGDDVVLRVTNTKTGAVAEVKPTAELLKLVASFKPQGQPPAAAADDRKTDTRHDADLEALARKIATMPVKDLCTVEVKKADKSQGASRR